jgi:uncharacterized lipoprotein YbaY
VITLQGTVAPPANVAIDPATTVRVTVQDVTQADRPIQVASEAQAAGSPPVAFSIDIPDRDYTRVALNLNVHVDRDGNGFFSRGDLICLTPHPVEPHVTTNVGQVNVAEI